MTSRLPITSVIRSPVSANPSRSNMRWLVSGRVVSASRSRFQGDFLLMRFFHIANITYSYRRGDPSKNQANAVRLAGSPLMRSPRPYRKSHNTTSVITSPNSAQIRRHFRDSNLASKIYNKNIRFSKLRFECHINTKF